MKRQMMGKRLNEARKMRGFTAEKLAEMCNINPVYLRHIEGGIKTPSLPVFTSLCNALSISPDFLLKDSLSTNELTTLHEITELWQNATPTQQEMILSMLKAALQTLPKEK